MTHLIPQLASVAKPVVGMLHLLPLPGAPRFGGKTADVRDALLRDADALVTGGVHALMLENFGDAPFYPGRVPAHTIAHMTALASEVRRRFHLPLGINVLRNDGLSALSVAHAVRAEFVRVNVLTSTRVADQGLLHGIAHDLLRLRRELNADHIKILADVDVKHSAPLAPRPLEDEVDDILHRGGADALVVSGAGTGKTTDPAKVAAVKRRAPHTPVLVGSGITAETLPAYLPHADAFIVGTAFKPDHDPANPVDVSLVRRLMAALTSA